MYVADIKLSVSFVSQHLYTIENCNVLHLKAMKELLMMITPKMIFEYRENVLEQ